FASPAEITRSTPRSFRWDYVVNLNRGRFAPQFEVWIRSVRDVLPVVPVPLDVGSPDIALDLQAIFERTYDAGRYAGRVDYAEDPVPPLREDDTRWMRALLREKGLR